MPSATSPSIIAAGWIAAASSPHTKLATDPLERALSKARRLLRDGDRTREPTSELVAALEKAEGLGRTVLRAS